MPVAGVFSFSQFGVGLAVVGTAALLTWLLSLYLRNVSIVDSLWSLMFALLAFSLYYFARKPLTNEE